MNRLATSALLLALSSLACGGPSTRLATAESAPVSPEPARASAAVDAAAYPPARPEDVASIDALLAATYAVISGEAGAPRDWDRFRSLFHPEFGRLMPVRRGADESVSVSSLSPQAYIVGAEAFFAREAFFERQLSHTTFRFGSLAQVASRYASTRAPGDDAVPFARGLNSFQLVHDGERWWILSIAWQQEDVDLPLSSASLHEG